MDRGWQVGLALSYGLGIAYALQGALRAVLQAELDLVSVERNWQYVTNLPQEEEPLGARAHRGGLTTRRALEAPAKPGATRPPTTSSSPPSPSSPSLPSLPSALVADTWPTAGRVEFRDVTLRYQPGLAPALRRLSFVAAAGERIGIVGRR